MSFVATWTNFPAGAVQPTFDPPGEERGFGNFPITQVAYSSAPAFGQVTLTAPDPTYTKGFLISSGVAVSQVEGMYYWVLNVVFQGPAAASLYCEARVTHKRGATTVKTVAEVGPGSAINAFSSLSGASNFQLLREDTITVEVASDQNRTIDGRSVLNIWKADQ